MKKIVKLLTCLIMIVTLTSLQAQKSDFYLSKTSLAGLKFRHLGPAMMSGRVIDFAVNPNNYHEYYVGVACGGVWKTVNSGITWEAIFDNEKSFSIGCVAIDPNNPFSVWVGTGENNSQRSVSWGDGVYLSRDGGKNWKNMGLTKSEHIAKIIIDPRNSNVVYVASQGPLWGPGGDRGLFKTSDEGQSWTKILEISENTGITDLVMDPRNPDVLYAASYQRRRHVYTLINGGPESAIYKSTDAGKTWRKIISGLPAGDIGRIGLAISPANPDILYAIIEASAESGGFYRSVNRGETWEKRNKYFSSSAQYYHELFCDPKNADRVYSVDTYTQVTDDGGKTFKNLSNKSRHVDDHALWINPNNTNHLLIGGDGGIYESFDLGENWAYKPNLSITQFYRVSADNALPFYNIYGGTQDNATIGGPSRTTSRSGIVNSDWFITVFGDGFKSQVDPIDPNIIYSQSQYGVLSRFDKKSGESINIQPQPLSGEDPYRWNWDSPLLISPHSNTRLFFASNIIFRSNDRGNSWTAVSGDLTRKIDRNQLPVMGKIQSPDAVAKNASTSLYGNIVSLAESPIKENLLYAGTDDGLIQVSMGVGEGWKKYDKFPGVPETTYVSCIIASMHKTNAVYASFDNHKRADFNPYILKSSNNGSSWESIRGDLPDNEVIYTIAEDHVNPELLFIGTEFGVYFTINSGKNWIKLKSGLPTISVRDIEIQRRENDLILATFGRGFYILDDYSVLRNLTSETIKKEATIFPVKDALMFTLSTPLGYGSKGSQGEMYFTADNPPFGVTFTYYVSDAIKTKKQIRKDAEKTAFEKGETIKYPTMEQLREEEEEEAPFLIFTITDVKGRLVRNLKAPATAGVQRINWDFRYPSTKPIRLGGNNNEFANESGGVLILPGEYKVKLSKSVNGVLTELTQPILFKTIPLNNTSLPAEDRNELVAFQQKVAELSRAVQGAERNASDLQNKLALIKAAILISPNADKGWMEQVVFIENKTKKILRDLNGDKFLESRNENSSPSIINRVNNCIYGMWNSTSSPTQTQRDNYNIAANEFSSLLAILRMLIEVDTKMLEDKLEKAKVPYTPGRIPQWEKE